jgi:hypothetical protein
MGAVVEYISVAATATSFSNVSDDATAINALNLCIAQLSLFQRFGIR